MYLPPTVVTPSVAGSMRMGFGIAAGFVLFLFVVIAVFAIIFGMLSGVLTWPFAKPGAVFTGTGPADSAAMTLGGTYTVEWAANPTSPSACHLDAALWTVNGAASVYIPLVYTPVGSSLNPESIHGIEVPARDDYLLRIASGCSWSIRLLEE